MTITVTHSTAADASFSATGAAAWDATHSFAGILDVANGGTGTATPSLVAGTNVTVTGTWPNQTIAASGGGSGTVTSVSVVSANGFAGTVANATTTPAVTLSTSITGVLKGNGTAISAASAGTDYQAPITLTTTGTSGAATFVSNTLNIPQYSGGGSGTVTSVAATVPSFLSVTGSPITTSGTLAISYSGTALPIANGGTGQTTAAAAITALTGTQTSGYYLRSDGTNATLSAIQVADVPTLNQNTTGTAANVTGTVAVANGGTGTTTPALVAGTNVTITGTWPNQTIAASGGGGSGTVTSVAATVPAFLSITGSPITTSGTLAIAYSGTALPIANGGTGQTTASAGFNALSPITTTGDLILGNGTNSATRLPIGTNGQVLFSDGSTAAWVSKITNGTAVTLTNQTTVDFTSLPSWVKRITVTFAGVSLSGTDGPLIQLGYGATPTYVTSGYSGGSQSLTTTPTSASSQPGTGIPIQNFTASNALVGIMTIVLLDSTTNTWIATYTGYNATTVSSFSNSSIALSGTLTAVRLTRTGTNTFDAGKVNILYE